MRKSAKILIITGTFILAVAFGVWYVNKFILPVKIKGLIVTAIKEKTGREVAIKKLCYLPFGRFYLEGVTLYDKDAPEKILANAKKIYIDLQVLPLLTKKNINARLNFKELAFGAIRLNGATSLSLKLGPSSAKRTFFKNIDGTIKLTNISFETDKLPSGVGSINGSIILAGDSVRLDKTFFNCRNTRYNVEGAVTGLSEEEPEASISLNSDILASEGKFIIKNDSVRIKNIDGKLLGSTFNIIGDIKFQSPPSLNLYCEAKVDLSDLNKLLPKSRYISNSLKPAGICDTTFFFNGRVDKLKSSEVGLKLVSSKVFLHGLALNDLYANLKFKDGLIGTENFTVKPYLGLFTAFFEADLNRQERPFSLSFALKNANLAKFSADMNFRKEDMTGLISSEFSMKGLLGSPEVLEGNGWITVTGGKLWEIPLLKGLAGILGMPNLRSVTFNEARGNFLIARRKVSTEDLAFSGDKVNMSAAGYVDFDKNINMLVNTDITQDLVKGDSQGAQIANLILTEAGNLIGKIRITGTLDKPQYNLAAKPIEELFKKEIKGLLKDILE